MYRYIFLVLLLLSQQTNADNTHSGYHTTEIPPVHFSTNEGQGVPTTGSISTNTNVQTSRRTSLTTDATTTTQQPRTVMFYHSGPVIVPSNNGTQTFHGRNLLSINTTDGSMSLIDTAMFVEDFVEHNTLSLVTIILLMLVLILKFVQLAIAPRAYAALDHSSLILRCFAWLFFLTTSCLALSKSTMPIMIATASFGVIVVLILLTTVIYRLVRGVQWRSAKFFFFGNGVLNINPNKRVSKSVPLTLTSSLPDIIAATSCADKFTIFGTTVHYTSEPLTLSIRCPYKLRKYVLHSETIVNPESTTPTTLYLFASTSITLPEPTVLEAKHLKVRQQQFYVASSTSEEEEGLFTTEKDTLV